MYKIDIIFKIYIFTYILLISQDALLCYKTRSKGQKLILKSGTHLGDIGVYAS